MHEKSKPAPPKEIRLVSKPISPPTQPVPAPKPATPPVEPDDEELDKAASLEDVMTTLGIGQEKAEVVEPGTPAPIKAPNMVEVAPGTVAIETANGPVTVEAEDPAAARALSKHKGKLKKLMGIVQAQAPTVLA